MLQNCYRTATHPLKLLDAKGMSDAGNDMLADSNGVFCGYASIFDTEDTMGDVIVSGAFSASLSEGRTVKLLWQHRSDSPIGVVREIYEDEVGLYIKGQLILGAAKADEVYELIKNNAIDGLSIGFKIEEEFYDNGVRYITKAKLWEVSIVTFPANRGSNITGIKSEVMDERCSEEACLQVREVIEVLEKANRLLM